MTKPSIRSHTARATRDGVPASRLQLPPGPWATVLDALCARFPQVGRDTWRERFARGRVLDADGACLDVTAPYRVGADVQYFREVPDEPAIRSSRRCCMPMRTWWWWTSRISCRSRPRVRTCAKPC